MSSGHVNHRRQDSGHGSVQGRQLLASPAGAVGVTGRKVWPRPQSSLSPRRSERKASSPRSWRTPWSGTSECVRVLGGWRAQGQVPPWRPEHGGDSEQAPSGACEIDTGRGFLPLRLGLQCRCLLGLVSPRPPVLTLGQGSAWGKWAGSGTGLPSPWLCLALVLLGTGQLLCFCLQGGLGGSLPEGPAHLPPCRLHHRGHLQVSGRVPQPGRLLGAT